MDRRRGRSRRAHRRAHVGSRRARDGRGRGAAPRATCSSSASPSAPTSSPARTPSCAPRWPSARSCSASSRPRRKPSGGASRATSTIRPASCSPGSSIAVRGIANRRAEKLSDLRSIADELAAQVHALAVQLRPTVLDDLGLVPALSQLIDSWAQRVGVPVDFETVDARRAPASRGRDRALPRRAGGVDEHVQARRGDGGERDRVEPRGRRERDRRRQRLRVRSERRRRKIGSALLGMRERVALAGGELVVESAPNRGTTVIARIPLATPPRAERLHRARRERPEPAALDRVAHAARRGCGC